MSADYQERWRGERGRRIVAEAKVKELRALTQDKRNLLAMCEQLQDELERLELDSQAKQTRHWQHLHDQQVEIKRAVKQRADNYRAIVTALLDEISRIRDWAAEQEPDAVWFADQVRQWAMQALDDIAEAINVVDEGGEPTSNETLIFQRELEEQRR